MDQNITNTASIISGVMVIFCGVITLPLGIGMLASYPNEWWELGLMLTGGSALLIGSGIHMFIKTNQKLKAAEKEKERILQVATKTSVSASEENPPTNSSHDPVLVTWQFSKEEWKKFLALERKRRKSSTVYESIAIIIFGTLVLIYSRESSLELALMMSTGLAIVIGLLRYTLTLKSYGAVLNKNSVSVTMNSILINEHLNPFRFDGKWLKRVVILDGEPDVMEFTYAWTTRKGDTFDELRIPIPQGQKEIAKKMIGILMLLEKRDL